MCGIAGFIYKNNTKKVEQIVIKKMTDSIVHRGPDAEGQYVDGNIGLGHRRLAIIDLSSDGIQPMQSYDERFVITFNGEIYNYIELREELKKTGSYFFSKTDTEVIIEAYRRWGVECFNRFNGMWAFCLYDRIDRKLILSRDRFGVKPLYYLWDDEKFVFGSEAKEILEVCPEEVIPNNKAIYRLLRSTPEDRDETSYYQNIKNYRRSTYTIIDLDSFSWSQHEYWRIDNKAFKTKWIDGKNPYKVCRFLVEDSIRLRLRADVEVGACLSGGLDSSLIVGVCKKKYNARIHTFSSVYEDKDCNEKEYIDTVNEFNESIAHIIYPEPEDKNIIDLINRIIIHHDGPCAGASLYSQYSVMEGAKPYVKVLLDGQGADELFGGYIPYYYYYVSDLLKKKKLISKIKAIKTISEFETEWESLNKSFGMDDVLLYLGDGFYTFLRKRWGRESDSIKKKEDALKGGIYTEDFLSKTDTSIEYEKYDIDGVLNSVLCKEVLRDGIPHLVHNEDGNSMAFSIETRLPFLDYRLVEFALALDAEYKIKGTWTKYIIRKSCRKYFPHKVLKRKNKMGFPAPFSRWLREGNAKNELRELVYAFADRNIVRKDIIYDQYEKHLNGSKDYGNILFKYVSLELWLRQMDTAIVVS